tara:strand:+ start:928 stop:1224 length:297 start_codon:yes stop_codon:yes gene_type:complete
MQDRLDEVNEIIESYEGGEYKDIFKMQRKLACNIHFLTDERVKYNVEWNTEYHNHNSTVNAVKTRYADKVVPELYMLRHFLSSASTVLMAISQEIKRN